VSNNLNRIMEVLQDLPAPEPTNGSAPELWFAERYPDVVKRHGAVLRVDEGADGTQYVTAINEDFLAAALGPLGTPNEPLVYARDQDCFYRYRPDAGIYVPESEPDVMMRLSGLLLTCVRECETDVDLRNMTFRLRKTSNLRGAVQRAKGVLAVSQDYFDRNPQEFIACQNGMLRLSDSELLPFGPDYRRRNKLMVPYEPGAGCPLFLDTLMKPAIDDQDIEMLQRWCGLALVGQNIAQVLLILSGTAGGGKGTFIRVLVGILGQRNVASLRTKHLSSRFEIGRLLGSTLLYGADVPADFLSCEGASVLKSLTGGDPVVVELKGSNERPELTCRFNIVVTCNSQLTLRLEGDADAWRRRLRIIEYRKPAPGKVITDLSERILRDEGPGVLNWMLQGLQKVREAGWQLHPSAKQQSLVDDLLMRSESHLVFVREALIQDEAARLTIAEAHEHYGAFCRSRRWTGVTFKQFSDVIQPAIQQHLGVVQRHDIPDRNGRPQRGWKGIRCR